MEFQYCTVSRQLNRHLSNATKVIDYLVGPELAKEFYNSVQSLNINPSNCKDLGELGEVLSSFFEKYESKLINAATAFQVQPIPTNGFDLVYLSLPRRWNSSYEIIIKNSTKSDNC